MLLVAIGAFCVSKGCRKLLRQSAIANWIVYFCVVAKTSLAQQSEIYSIFGIAQGESSSVVIMPDTPSILDDHSPFREEDLDTVLQPVLNPLILSVTPYRFGGDAPLLTDFFANCVSNLSILPKPHVSEEDSEVQKAYAQLYADTERKAPTPKYSTYLRLRRAVDSAADLLAAARSNHQSDAVIVELNQKNVDANEQFESFRYKFDIEQALDAVHGRNSTEEDATDRKSAMLLSISNNLIGQFTSPLHLRTRTDPRLSPIIQWATEDMQNLNDIRVLLQGAHPNDSAVALEVVATDKKTRLTSKLKVRGQLIGFSFQFIRLRIIRPWLDPIIVRSGLLTNGLATAGSGSTAESGAHLQTNIGAPFVPNELLLVRNLEIRGVFEHDDLKLLRKAVLAGNSLAVGPFCIGAGDALDSNSVGFTPSISTESLSFKPLQLLAWICIRSKSN